MSVDFPMLIGSFKKYQLDIKDFTELISKQEKEIIKTKIIASSKSSRVYSKEDRGEDKEKRLIRNIIY